MGADLEARLKHTYCTVVILYNANAAEQQKRQRAELARGVTRAVFFVSTQGLLTHAGCVTGLVHFANECLSRDSALRWGTRARSATQG